MAKYTVATTGFLKYNGLKDSPQEPDVVVPLTLRDMLQATIRDMLQGLMFIHSKANTEHDTIMFCFIHTSK